MVPLTIRQLEPDEGVAFARSVTVPFLDPHPEEEFEKPYWQRYVRGIEPSRTWVAVDDGRFVGNCTVYTMDVTVPSSPGRSCPVVPMGGVSGVGVHPTHRRRGILTSMMNEMLADIARRGEPLAGLIASESVIYGRYGFGVATESATASIASRRAQMIVAPPGIDLHLVEGAEAAKVLPGLFDRFRTRRAGEPMMRESAWEGFLADYPEIHEGAGFQMIAAGDDGYVAYRARGGEWPHEPATLEVSALWAVDDAAEAALWRYLFDVDLAEPVVAARRPLDEPLRWRLADPRQLRLDGVVDRLHVRVMDVPVAFGQRGYAAEGRLVLDVTPPPAGTYPGDPVPGRWVIDAGPDGATAGPAPAGAVTDLRLDAAALGTLYMGGFAASALAGAGRIEELRPGALATADRLLLTRPLPSTVTGF